ncbi:hypothetical protein [Flavihumibacter profundi]|uniref:hypothetical protein n=1 Tax=Flavihumibacter profundi TaxID=2716883 RepID=UPI001CC7E09F|nr:hypothetical protein [Flavihumibacter profundi]MBZ5859423.1 hypothetical protein [Flavihumibacter profundi]
MARIDESTPVSTSLSQLFRKNEVLRNSMVNERVFYLGIQAVINAILIGFLAKLLVSLIALIMSLAFYGRFSLDVVACNRSYCYWFNRKFCPRNNGCWL